MMNHDTCCPTPLCDACYGAKLEEAMDEVWPLVVSGLGRGMTVQGAVNLAVGVSGVELASDVVALEAVLHYGLWKAVLADRRFRLVV